MPRGVGVLQRVVQHVRVPVQRLRVARLRHHRIRLHKPPQRRVVPSGIVKVQPYCTLFTLPGEGVLLVATDKGVVGRRRGSTSAAC